MEKLYDIRGGEIIEMMDGKSFEVINVMEFDGVNGKLKMVEVDDDNKHIGEQFVYDLTVSSPVRDIIR